MRVLIAVCAALSGARLRRRGKPMNFVPDGVHRMFQLTHRDPREDMGCTIDFRFRCEQQGLCSPANVNNLSTTVQMELIGTVGVRTIEMSVRSDGDNGGSQFFLNP